MDTYHLMLAALLVTVQICAGGALLRAILGQATSALFRFACAYCTGTAVLCIQMLLFGWCFGAYSYWGIVGPWLVVGAVWGARALAGGQLQVTGRRLAILLGAAAFLALALYCSVPAIGGDPASNFSGFGRLYAYLGQVDPLAGQQLSIYGHFEYPPLISSNESLFFMIDDASGAALLMVMFAMYGLVFTILCSGILLGGTKGRTRVIGTLLLCLVLLQPTTFQLITNGYADLPLTCSFLWMLIEVERQAWPRKSAQRPSIWSVVIPGIAMALTKNEGVVLACGLACLIPLIRGWRFAWVPALMAGITSLWPLLIMQSGLESEWIEGASHGLAWKNIERIPMIILELADRLLLFDRNPGWGISSFVLAALFILLLTWLKGLEFTKQRIVLALCALHLTLYVGVFVVTSSDYLWHLKTAATRLVFHLVPYLLLSAGMCLRESGVFMREGESE
jgi:hypothetical protein